MVVIGLLGKKHVGKDTFADYLVQEYGFIKLTLAKPLKDICQILFDFSHEQLYDDKLKEIVDPRWGVSPRVLMQYIGTDILRNDISRIINVGSQFWIKKLRFKCINVLKKNPNAHIVISDLRFDNECDLAHEFNGTVIKINRKDYNIIDGHESEKNIDLVKNYDIVVKNDSTIKKLYKKIDDIVSKYI